MLADYNLLTDFFDCDFDQDSLDTNNININNPLHDQRFDASQSPRFKLQDSLYPGASPASSAGSALSSPFYNLSDSNRDSTSEDALISMVPGSNPTMQQSDQWFTHSSNLNSARSIGQSGKLAHNRDSSSSSLGSAGPTSPYPLFPNGSPFVAPDYSQNTSNPQIVLNDSDSLPNMSSFYDGQHSFPMAKQASSSTSDSFYGQAGTFSASDALGDMLAPNRQSANDRGLQFLSDMTRDAGSNRSQPVSGASSIASNSPATPLLEHAEDDARRRNGENPTDAPLFSSDADVMMNTAEDLFALESGVAGSLDENDEYSQFYDAVFPASSSNKMNRTMADVFADDMYGSSGFNMPTSAPMSQHMSQPTNQQFSASAHHSPAHTSSPGNSSLRFSSMPLQQERSARSHGASTPQTISPKDAVLEYTGQDGEADGANYSLFAQRNQQAQLAAAASQVNKPMAHMNQPYAGMAGSVVTSAPLFNSYMPTHMPTNMPTTMQQLHNYPFVPQQQVVPQTQSHNAPSNHRPTVPVPRTVTSLAALSEPVPGSQRPGIVTTDGGTYTCTYHGCTKRFDSPTALQKHKREIHRQVHALTTARRPDDSLVASLNTQAGPHRCERINPSTGKPCNTIFSRPYDLTRHEDTIHNARKQKVRCNLCTEEKTFSRADALTRHFRVCHPEVEFTGKHRKRGGGVHSN